MNHLQIFMPNQKTTPSLMKRDRYSDLQNQTPMVSQSPFQDTLDSRGSQFSATDTLMQRFTESLMALQVFIKDTALAPYLKLQNQGQNLDRYDCLIRIPLSMQDFYGGENVDIPRYIVRQLKAIKALLQGVCGENDDKKVPPPRYKRPLITLKKKDIAT